MTAIRWLIMVYWKAVAEYGIGGACRECGPNREAHNGRPTRGESFSKTFSRWVSNGSCEPCMSCLHLLGNLRILGPKNGHEPPDSDPRLFASSLPFGAATVVPMLVTKRWCCRAWPRLRPPLLRARSAVGRVQSCGGRSRAVGPSLARPSLRALALWISMQNGH